MGFNADGTRFLLYARQHGVSFERTATLGRQELHLTTELLDDNLRDFGIRQPRADVEQLLVEGEGYADPFLKMLGASAVTSFDAASYEGASVVHDFNQPIPKEFRGRFSAVVDGGSLEHVFNFPTAVSNCMEMLEVGGHFLGISPANNFFGHGFYQFSPELYYRVFSEENGFEVRRMLVFEDDAPLKKWMTVDDPKEVGERVTLVNFRPTYIAVVARKIADLPQFFARYPQQSDYAKVWEAPRRPTVRSNRPAVSELVEKLKAGLPRALLLGYRAWVARRRLSTGYNPRHFHHSREI